MRRIFFLGLLALTTSGIAEALEFTQENSQSCRVQVVSKNDNPQIQPQTICHGALLENQKVAFTPTCFPVRIHHRTQKLQLSCLEGLVVKDITATDIPSMKRDSNGIHYINVDVKMDIPFRPSGKRTAKEENCFYEAENSRHPLKDYLPEKYRLWGAPVYCTQGDQPILVGILGASGMLEFESPEKLVGETYRPDDVTQNVCQELGHCLNNLVGLPDNLTDKIRVLEHMVREDEVLIRGSVTQLKIDAHSLLHKCHEEKIDAELAPKQLESGFMALLAGKIESAYMSAFHTHEEMADEVINSAGKLLKAPETIRSQIVTWLDSKETSDLSNLDKIKGSAQIVASAVLREKMSPLGLTSKEEQDAVLLRIMPSYKECLASAVNATSKVKECSEELQKKAPIVIGRAVVERNFEKNFSSQFNNENDEAQVRKQTLATFDRCISDFYLKEMNEKSAVLSTEEMTKACVYESLSSTFNQVVDKKIGGNISELELPPSERLALKQEIIKRGLNCPMSEVISKAPNYSRAERRYLGKVSSASFESSIKACQNAITTYASDTLIPKILSSHRDIVKAIPEPSARENFVASVINGPYQECKGWFSKQQLPYKVAVCESIVRHQAFIKVAGLELAAKASSYGVTDTLKIMLDFKACNMQIERQLLALNPYENREKEEIACLQGAVEALAAAAVPIKIQAEIDNIASLAPIKDQILNSPGIKSLEGKMRTCLADDLNGEKTLTAFNEQLKVSIDACAFEVTKNAYSEIVPMALEIELQNNIPSASRRAQFIENFKRDTLVRKISSLQLGADSKSFLSDIKRDVMRAYAASELDQMLEGPLAQIKSSRERERLAGEVRADFIGCIESSKNVETCPNAVTVGATKKIGGAALEENIRSVIKDERADELSDRTRGELNRCIDSLQSPTENAAKSCVGQVAINLTANIPALVLNDYSKLLGSKLSPSKLEGELKKVKNFYESKGGASFNDRDPAVMLYATHQTCLSSAREQISRGALTLESALESSNKCAKQFEESVLSGMRRKFTGVSTSRTIRGELSKIFDVLMLFKDAARPDGGQNSSADEQDLAPLMEMIASMSKDACNYDLATCQARVKALKEDMNSYASTPPAKTMEQLKERLVKSSFMDLIIEAQVAKSLKSELTNGLATMRDNIGYLDMSINNITSPSILRAIMNSSRGRVLLAEVKVKVLAGQTDNLTASPRIRQALAGALVANTAHNSFVDHLFYGIVEPQILQKKGSFTGVLGRALGIVKSDKFTWREIRKTPEGQHARALFARFFAGVVTGEVEASDIKAPSARIKARGYPSEKEIVDLITRGLKSL